MLSFFTFIIAMFITMLLIPPLMKSAERFSFIDTPGVRKIHSAPIPRIGGIAMVVGVVTPVLMWVERPPIVVAFLLGIAVILFFGLWDDRRQLDFRLKFFGQFLAISIVIFYGGVEIFYLPFHSIDPVPRYVSIPFTYFALLGVTNAINLADGLDGLAGGMMLLTTAAIGLLAYLSGDDLLVIFSLAVMGSIIGFLRYNTHPAQVFMGDCGSQFLGFAVGVLVIVLTQKSNPALSPSMTLLILGLPIIDTFIVMGQRAWEGRSLFKPDRNHVHHKLLAIGLDHYEAVVVTYIIQAILVTLAFLCRFENDLFNMLLFAGILLAIVGGFKIAQAARWAVHGNQRQAPLTPLGGIVKRLQRSGALSDYPVAFIAVSVPHLCDLCDFALGRHSARWIGHDSRVVLRRTRAVIAISSFTRDPGSRAHTRVCRCDDGYLLLAHHGFALSGCLQLREFLFCRSHDRDRFCVSIRTPPPVSCDTDGFLGRIPRRNRTRLGRYTDTARECHGDRCENRNLVLCCRATYRPSTRA